MREPLRFGEITLAPPQCFFRQLSCGDIADGSGNKGALFGLERTETDFHGKLRSVFPPSVQLPAFTHRPQARLSEELLAVLGVRAPKSLRHQNLNLSPQELVPQMPKQLLDLSIDQHDLALPIHDDHCIRSGFQKPAEFPLSLLALGYVSQSTHKFQVARGSLRLAKQNIKVLHRTIRHLQPMLEIKLFPCPDRAVDSLLHEVSVVRMNSLEY